MKIKAITLLLFSYLSTYPQVKTDFSKLPFDIETLKSLSHKKDSIMPKLIGDSFFYVNTISNKKVSDIGFETAYPFAGNKSTIVKLNGKFGIIDTLGNLLVKPTNRIYKIKHGLFNQIRVDFMNNTDSVFDLRSGKYVRSGSGCKFPVRREIFGFKGKNKKYGVLKRNSNNKYKKIIRPIFDSIYLVNNDLIIASKKNQIGIIDKFKNILVPFKYENIILSKSSFYTSSQFIGMNKDTIWEYYQLVSNPKFLFKSEFKCFSMGEVRIKNGFGIFNINGKYNIYFNDGTTLENEYDWISDNGTIAIDEKKVFIIGDDGIPYLYYESN